MIKYILPFWAIISTSTLFAQNTFNATVKDSITNEILTGVSVKIKNTKIVTLSDLNGKIVLNNIPNGAQTLLINYFGFQSQERTLNFPLSQTDTVIYLLANQEELDEVVVQSTRTSRSIANTPTRIETIEFEEIDEKSNMKPANVSMVLHESTGIQVQQTSATSGNASIRIQGLDGRYTQLLKDGYPSFGNFASGLSILEIPPLDLKQVEIIKGSASTLYGAGAIAGVVNFISKTPKEKPENNFIINQSNVGQSNIGGFSSGRGKKLGYTILGLVNNQKPYDVDEDNFTELPQSKDFTIFPKIFYYPSVNTTFILGNSFSKGDRTGGDINVINGQIDNQHNYFETNKTIRNTTTLDFIQKLEGANQLSTKSAFSYFNRDIAIPNSIFSGINYNVYSDVSYLRNLNKQSIIFGGNYILDKFSESKANVNFARDFETQTGGLYVQHTWDVSEKLKLESGLRTDLVKYSNQNYNKTEIFALPRISALININEKWSSRLGAGLGYKTPTIFTEQTETIQYQKVLPLNNVSSEKSLGATADVNFKTAVGTDFFLSANQMFFYTRINNATVLEQNLNQQYFFNNTKKPIYSAGFETNGKLIYKEDFKFFFGYTFTYAKAAYLPNNQFLRLVPKSKLNTALVFEKERNFKLGLEGYFTDKQFLNNLTQSPSFWEFGFMAEKTFGKISLFVNAENFTDVRQSRYKRVVNPPFNNPTFDDIWTHTEGRTFNGGIKLKLN